MFKEDLLKGKRILVTGGGTGLGKEMAYHYAQHGQIYIYVGDEKMFLKILLLKSKTNIALK